MTINTVELGLVKVLVVDQHTLFAEGIAALISLEPRISVAGIANNGIECMKSISKIVLDIVLLDINLPDTCVTHLIDKIKKVHPEVKFIMLTEYSPKGYVIKSLSKSVNGFLLKECSVKEVIQGILKVYDGGVYFSKSLEGFLRPGNDSNKLHSPPVKPKMLSELTPREAEIIELVSRGLHNKEIASTLGINVRTVEFHVSNILIKLGVSKRFEAVLRWANVDKEILYL